MGEGINFLTLSKKDGEEKRKNGKPWAPVYFPLEMGKEVAAGEVGFFDAACQRTENLDDVQYVVHPSTLPSPPGFNVVHGSTASDLAAWAGMASAYPLPYVPVEKSEPKVVAEDPNAAGPEDEVQELTRTADGYALMSPRSHKRIQATNFLIDIASVTHVVGAEGEEKKVLELEIWLCGSDHVEALMIGYPDIDVVGQVITKQIGEAIIFPRTKKTFLGLVGYELRKRLRGCRHRYKYTVSGWTCTPQGALVYVRDGAAPPHPDVSYQCGFSFGRLAYDWTHQKLVAEAWKLLGLSKKQETILIPFLFAHLGVLWSLFDMAGYPPHLLLFIKGVTGSLKTAVASLLFNFSAEREARIPATFRDTSASTEVKMARYKDRVFLVDDFCPAASENAKRILEQNLEQLVRFYGDGIAKSRTNPRLSEVYEKKPHGLCAITGEDAAGSYSSMLRCLFVNVEQESFEKSLLAAYQSQPAMWTAYLEAFVGYCEANVRDIIAFIGAEFPQLREEGQAVIKERRLVDAFADLKLTAEIALSFAGEYLGMNAQARRTQSQTFSQIILDVCGKSEEEAKEMEPAQIFVRLLSEGVSMNKIKLASRDEFKEAPQHFIGYLDDRFYYLLPTQIFEFVKREYERGAKRFPLSMRHLWEAIYVAGILRPQRTREEAGSDFEYTYRVPIGSRPRMLRIDPTTFEKYL